MYKFLLAACITGLITLQSKAVVLMGGAGWILSLLFVGGVIATNPNSVSTEFSENPVESLIRSLDGVQSIHRYPSTDEYAAGEGLYQETYNELQIFKALLIEIYGKDTLLGSPEAKNIASVMTNPGNDLSLFLKDFRADDFTTSVQNQTVEQFFAGNSRVCEFVYALARQCRHGDKNNCTEIKTLVKQYQLANTE